MNLLTSRTHLPGSQEVVDEPVDDLWTTCGRPVDEPPGEPPGRSREPPQFDPLPDQPPDLLTSPPNGRSGQEVRFRVKPPGQQLRKFRNLVLPNFPPHPVTQPTNERLHVMTSRLSVVVGAQYGSEGKGAIAGHLAKTSNRPVVCVRIGGPNAGHTVLGHGPEGNLHPWRLRTIPVAAVVDHQATLVIAAGSEIDLTVLVSEAEMLENWGHPVWDRLYIDPQATILDQTHIDTEQNLGIQGRLGSTAKGIGAARAARIMRTARLWDELTTQHRTPPIPTADYLDAALSEGQHIIVEGTQGYGLGLHAGHYPQCTSNDARAVDFLSMAGINPWSANVGKFTIYAVARTHPIRVAGNSGPLQDETTWEDLGLDPELTTVTRKVRRVGMWDPNLVRDAVAANGGAPTVALCLTMLDHVVPEVANYTGPISLLPEPAKAWIRKAEQDSGTRVAYVGTGPDTVAGSM